MREKVDTRRSSINKKHSWSAHSTKKKIRNHNCSNSHHKQGLHLHKIIILYIKYTLDVSRRANHVRVRALRLAIGSGAREQPPTDSLTLSPDRGATAPLPYAAASNFPLLGRVSSLGSSLSSEAPRPFRSSTDREERHQSRQPNSHPNDTTPTYPFLPSANEWSSLVTKPRSLKDTIDSLAPWWVYFCDFLN
jgi:hypothetical protein